MRREEKFQQVVKLLENSQNEEEVIEYLTKMLKEFSIYFYKDIIVSNPYFKSLIPEIRDKVKIEILSMKKSILDEIKIIEKEILKFKVFVSPVDLEKYIELKRDCLLLLEEVIERERELNSL
jgi:hypothetical protein